jgi:inosose dehydratase
MTNTEPPASETRIAGAPISWGVCEVPGWGYQLGPDRVLAEMRQVGLTATELGPDGFLPAQPDAMTRVLDHHGLRAVGGFTPLLLHVAAHDPAPEVERLLQGYAELARRRGVRAVLHPHVGTMIETGEEVRQVLDGSWISLCLDTGHLLIGGTDPAELAAQAPERIAHVHFKDVDAHLARRVQDGRLTYTQGVREGMYRPLGSGDVDVSAIVGSLRARGYTGWYVLEQDTILTEEPRGDGPVADVWASAEYLRSVLRRTR